MQIGSYVSLKISLQELKEHLKVLAHSTEHWGI
jgi:hypothetical protein